MNKLNIMIDKVKEEINLLMFNSDKHSVKDMKIINEISKILKGTNEEYENGKR